jgi:glycerate 2-kinase
MLIRNFNSLALTKERELLLKALNYGLEKIQPENYLKEKIKFYESVLEISGKTYDLENFENVYLVAYGKGSSLISKYLEENLGDFLKEGYVIDTKEADFKKIYFTLGTHPLPSKENLEFTEKVVKRFEGKLRENDLVIVITCGGGSVLFEKPAKIGLEEIIKVNEELLKSGADIYEMNTVRKHLSLVKGGGLAKILYPAKIISLILSDIPGDDISFIASGPTVKDETTLKEALETVKKFNLKTVNEEWLIETPKEDIYFENIDYFLLLSNKDILNEIKNFLEKERFGVEILTYTLSGNVKEIAEKFKSLKAENKIYLCGGETTVEVKGKGIGGRNQELVLWFLKFLKEKPRNTIFISFNTDGIDNTEFGGALGDLLSLKKAEEMNLNIDEFLENNDSFNFFKKIDDGIITGKLSSNVSDIMILANF